jgi:hypothetical protein
LSALSGLGRGATRPEKLMCNLRSEQLAGFTSTSHYPSFDPRGSGH